GIRIGKVCYHCEGGCVLKMPLPSWTPEPWIWRLWVCLRNRLVPKLAYYFGNASAWSYLLNIRWHTPTIRNYLCSPRILLLLLQLVQDRCSMTTPCGPVLKPVFSPSFHSRSPTRIWV